jgi:hypothetical protein
MLLSTADAKRRPATLSVVVGLLRQWNFVVVTESIVAALCLGRIAFGPVTKTPSPILWSLCIAIVLSIYLYMDIWSAKAILTSQSGRGRKRLLIFGSTIPFTIAFASELLLLQFHPEIGDRIWGYMSTIQPFPVVAMAIVLEGVFLLKIGAISLAIPEKTERAALLSRSADFAAPFAMLLIGILQASVYIIPIGNAFLRFWAIADALTLGVGYPVTLTEPGPMSAGSPPYVYDLPLFPMMLWGVFSLFGHNSAAAYLPSAFFNILFPLSAYLLIREATHSRVVGLLFGSIVSLFPYFRFWVLNLPDPDPMLLTSLCFAGYFYLKALAAPGRWIQWSIAGISAGVLSLARPEGVLYAGCLSLGLLASRPKVRQFGLYSFWLGLFLIPMIATWVINFGFLWPQNYNHTLRLDYPLENYNILESMGALGFYYRGLGLSAEGALIFIALFALSVLLGVLVMAAKNRYLLALAIPGIGNTVMIFFANPYIPNTFHFADFFRHASFGIPLLVLTAAYGLNELYKLLSCRTWSRGIGYAGLLLLVLVVVREGDILANPTATHRPGIADQVLTTYTYLSMQDILDHPFQLPQMSYYDQGDVIVAHCTAMDWPDDAINHYKPLDMAFDSQGSPFGYASVPAFLVALCFALLAEGQASGPIESYNRYHQDSN